MKRFLKIAIVVLVLGGVEAGVSVRLHSNSAAASTEVSTATVQRDNLSATLATASNVQAHQSVDLSFGQSGTVKAIASRLAMCWPRLIAPTSTCNGGSMGAMGIPGAGGPLPGMWAIALGETRSVPPGGCAQTGPRSIAR